MKLPATVRDAGETVTQNSSAAGAVELKIGQIATVTGGTGATSAGAELTATPVTISDPPQVVGAVALDSVATGVYVDVDAASLQKPLTVTFPEVTAPTSRLQASYPVGLHISDNGKATVLPAKITTAGLEVESTQFSTVTWAMARARTPLAAGSAHTCAVVGPAGRVACWGDNTLGQLADSSQRGWSTVPVNVAGVSGASAVVATAYSTCAAATTGSGPSAKNVVQCWGNNRNGELGNGSKGTKSSIPVAVTNPGTVVALAAGEAFVCALDQAGSVRCWGDFATGGHESLPHRIPTLIKGVTGATALAADRYQACAVLADKTVRCWGYSNDKTDIGESGTLQQDSVAVARLSGATGLRGGWDTICGQLPGRIACLDGDTKKFVGTPTETAPAGVLESSGIGSGFWCTIATDKTVFCRGANGAGQLGQSDTNAGANKPVSNLTDVDALIVGPSHSCALTSSSAVRCWGAGVEGQLGDGYQSDRPAPVTVIGTDPSAQPPVVPKDTAVPRDGSAVDAAGVSLDHACTVRTNGTVRCWGLNEVGQLGDGSFAGRAWAPVDVVGLPSATGVSVLMRSTCALTQTRTVWCWGLQLDGTNVDNDAWKTLPNMAPTDTGLTDVTAISGTWAHMCAVHADHTISCWGANEHGQLGDGTTTTTVKPVKVSGLSTAVSVSAGPYTSCAVLSDGQVACWGTNSAGMLGRTAGDSTTPVIVPGISKATAVSVSFSHACAIVDAGQVKCWGSNAFGALGARSPATSSATPLLVAGLKGVRAVSVGYNYGCAVLADRTARCWGDNSDGQLGYGRYGSRTSVNQPVIVRSLGGAVAVATTSVHPARTCTLHDDGTARCWGRSNSDAPLGNGVPFHGPPGPDDVFTTPVAVLGR